MAPPTLLQRQVGGTTARCARVPQGEPGRQQAPSAAPIARGVVHWIARPGWGTARPASALPEAWSKVGRGLARGAQTCRSRHGASPAPQPGRRWEVRRALLPASERSAEVGPNVGRAGGRTRYGRPRAEWCRKRAVVAPQRFCGWCRPGQVEVLQLWRGSWARASSCTQDPTEQRRGRAPAFVHPAKKQEGSYGHRHQRHVRHDAPAHSPKRVVSLRPRSSMHAKSSCLTTQHCALPREPRLVRRDGPSTLNNSQNQSSSADGARQRPRTQKERKRRRGKGREGPPRGTGSARWWCSLHTPHARALRASSLSQT